VGLKASVDLDIWQYAKSNQLLIVSKDSDLYQYSLVYGPPPKVVWIRRGNCSTATVERILREHFSDIERFADDADSAYLILW
jgi:predicted nuclease of predicted toxin-antitoxin system